MIWRDFVTLSANTPWLRLYFSNIQLEKGSSLHIVSLLDGGQTTMLQHDVIANGSRSAYFAGNAVMIEIVAGANTRKNYVEIDKVQAGDAGSPMPPQEIPTGIGPDGGGDECGGAVPVIAGTNGPFDTTGSTTSAPAWPCGAGGNDEWFVLNTCAGAYTFSTCTAARTFDTVIEVFTGGCGALASIGCNDDTGGACGLGSTLAIAAVPAGTVWIRVGGFGGATGIFELVITSPCHGNDECAGAIPLVLGANPGFSNATASNSLPVWPCGAGGRDCWFSYTPAGCRVTVDTCGSAFDTTLQIFSGTCGALASLGCNDDACGLQSRLSASSSGTILIRVGGFGGATGAFTINVAEPGPANDECAGAVTVSNGLNGPFCTPGATTSVPAWPCGAGGNDVWHSYTAPHSGTLTVTTCTPARSYDTTLELFSGGCGALVSLGCNDDTGGPCGLGSSIGGIAVTGGTTYQIRVGGFGGATGTYELLITLSGAAANDECTGAVPVVLGTNGLFSNTTSTTSAPWPCAAGACDVWFQYTAPCSGTYEFTTCTAARTFDTCIEVFSGACGGLTSLGCNDDAGGACGLGSTLSLALSGGVYLIRVGGFAGNIGSFELVISRIGGSIALACGGCGPLTISVTGDPHIGGSVTTTIAGHGAGLPFVGLGFGPFCASPFCTCNVGHGWQSINFGTSVTLNIPCSPIFVGAQVGSQGVGFNTLGGCPAPPVSFSDTMVITIG